MDENGLPTMRYLNFVESVYESPESNKPEKLLTYGGKCTKVYPPVAWVVDGGFVVNPVHWVWGFEVE